MIIVSQDKTKILNFDNIEVIGIGNPLENNDGKFQILVDTTNDNEFTIAEYETEERAKEVLKEITKTYFDENCEFANGMYHLQKIHEMPAEKVDDK